MYSAMNCTGVRGGRRVEPGADRRPRLLGRIHAVRVVYEGPAADDPGQIAPLFETLGLDVAADPGAPTQRQADATSASWIERSLALHAAE